MNNCDKCEYMKCKPKDEDCHCYMFKEAPEACYYDKKISGIEPKHNAIGEAISFLRFTPT